MEVPGEKFDFIGDIHGHANKLVEMLTLLGYSNKIGSYAHPSRKAFFVGDYIDRGPQIVHTLEIVKGMVDNNNAIALMGNHEYNALCFHYQAPDGGHLRKHSIKNIIQHFETLKQFQNRQAEYELYIEWFKTLPLYYEAENFRAVHSCWDKDDISYLRKVLDKDRLTEDLLYESVIKSTQLYRAIENTLKGKEMRWPGNGKFFDKDGHERSDFRIKWWEDPALSTYKSISVQLLDELPDTNIDSSLLKDYHFYNLEDKPVFFGHYWLKGSPILYRSNICCLDYSVAKNGYLVSYGFDGEQKLDNRKLRFV